MKRTLFLPFALLLMLSAAFLQTSCIDDSFTTSPADVLTFSRDTVSFDTVFTDVGTPTARLVVHNHASKAVNISEIRFRNENSNFQLNVDGMSGKVFHDIEIRGKDSIYVFIECFISPTATAEPYLVEDQLDFTTNGVRQEVQVEAWGQNVTRLHALTIDSDMTLTAERPYIIFDSLTVGRNARLTIEKGAKVLFHDKASLVVHGSLVAEGTPDAMIDLRGDRLDNVLPDAPYDILANQWNGIRITRESFDNRLSHVNMRSTSVGIDIDSCGDLSRRKLLLVNSWLHNSGGNVLTSRHAWVDAYGVCFSEAAGAVVSLTGGKHTMQQCTFANNYLFGAPYNAIVYLDGIKETENTPGGNPLMEASFENCIIYGMGVPISPSDLTGSKVYLRYVLFGVKGEDDDNFLNCIWESDPLFLTRRSDYYFNYHVAPDSPAIGAGNPAFVTELSLYDMNGNNRLSDGKPTLGAYQKPEEPQEE